MLRAGQLPGDTKLVRVLKSRDSGCSSNVGAFTIRMGFVAPLWSTCNKEASGIMLVTNRLV